MTSIDLAELSENNGHSKHIDEILKNGTGHFVPEERSEGSNLSPKTVSFRASSLMS